MDKQLNTRDSELLRKVRVMKLSDEWPFRTVSADDFVKASTPLMEMLRNSEERIIGSKRVSPEMYMDRTVEAAILMLKCVHKLQFEASTREMESMINGERDGIYNMDFFDAYEFAEYAYAEMCECNNRICDNLAPDLKKNGIEPIYMDLDNENTYLIDEERCFAERAADDHYEAFKCAYDKIEPLMQYGLPADGVVGKIMDKIVGSADIKNNNQEIVNRLLNSEADIEIVGLYILPELNRRIKEYEAQARIEEMNTKDNEEMEKGELRQSDPYFFRREYEKHVAARDSIEKALLIMQKKEFQLESDYRLFIDKDPKTATYVLTAQWSCGDRDVQHSSQPLTNDFSRNSTVVKVKNRKEKSIEIKVGRSSKKLYEETKKRTACKFGYMNRQELKTNDKVVVNTFSADTMRKEAMIRRKTKVAGKNVYDAKFSFDTAKVEDKLSYEFEGEDGTRQKQTVLSASADIGSISAKTNTKLGVPIVGASIEAAGAKAAVLDTIRVRTSAASIHCDVGGIASRVLEGAELGDALEGMISKMKDDDEQPQLFPPDGSEFEVSENDIGSIDDDSVDMNLFDKHSDAEMFQERSIDDMEMVELCGT